MKSGLDFLVWNKNISHHFIPWEKRGESVAVDSCTRKAVHNKDIMKNITLIHIDFCFVCWLAPLLPWQSHEQCHPSSANEKTSAAAVRLLEKPLPWAFQKELFGMSSTGKCWAEKGLL